MYFVAGLSDLSDKESVDKFQNTCHSHLRQMVTFVSPDEISSDVESKSLKFGKLLLLLNSTSKFMSEKQIETLLFTSGNTKNENAFSKLLVDDLLDNIVKYSLLTINMDELNTLNEKIPPEVFSMVTSFRAKRIVFSSGSSSHKDSDEMGDSAIYNSHNSIEESTNEDAASSYDDIEVDNQTENSGNGENQTNNNECEENDSDFNDNQDDVEKEKSDEDLASARTTTNDNSNNFNSPFSLFKSNENGNALFNVNPFFLLPITNSLKNVANNYSS
jgi:hypothetical protein